MLASVVLGIMPSLALSSVAYASPIITEYSLTISVVGPFGPNNAYPNGITAGSDGDLWFTELGDNAIGRIAIDGSLSKFQLPTANAYPEGITSGPDGAVWFVEYGAKKIGRIDTSGTISEYDIPDASSSLQSVVAGPDGALWFTEQSLNKVARLTTSGTITQYIVPQANSLPYAITKGPDGALWFTESSGNRIGRISPMGVISTYAVPTPNSRPEGIIAGPDGALWFTEEVGNKIGRITTDGIVSEYSIPTPGSATEGIAQGSDGTIWFTENGSNKVGNITTDGRISDFAAPTTTAYLDAPSGPMGIVTGSNGALWLTEFYANKIGTFLPSSVSVAPTSLTAPSPVQTPILSWSASSGASSYNVYRNGTKIDSTVDTTYTDSTAPEGTDTYYVTAVNSSGESAPSNSVDVVVDRTAPNVTGVAEGTASDGWHNQDTSIDWASTDPDPSSGAPTQPAPTPVSTEGDITYTSDQSCDPTGNCATGSLEVKLDKTAPTIDYTVSPTPNGTGWDNSDVTVTFTCSDALSGVATCPSPVAVSTEGTGQTVIGTATDNAGNSATVTASINVDKTAPIITAALSQQPNANGWFNSPTTVSYACSDGLSGITLCANPQTESTDGMYTLSGTAVDNAGNTSSVLTQVNIDATAPTLGSLTWTANPVQQGSDTTMGVSATDNLSGVASVYYTVNGGAPQAMAYDAASATWRTTFGASLASGTYNIEAYAQDNAGNTSVAATDVLVVSAAGAISGHAKLLPTSGDVLPIAEDTAVHNPTDLVVAFGGPQTSNTKTEVQYIVKNNKDEFDVNNTTVDWIIIPDNTHASLMLHGNLVTYVNGVMSTTIGVVMRIDVTLGANSSSQDLVTVSIWNPGQNPNADAPAYHASEYDENGSSISIN